MSEELRLRARNLLALALEAQGRGQTELAEQLTARAMQFLDEANGTTDVATPSAPPSPVPQQQQQQQQQQRQADPDKSGADEDPNKGGAEE